VVGLSGDDLVRTEELLEQYDSDELMRERHWPERETMVGALELTCPRIRETVRAADHERQVATRHPPLLEEAGERFARVGVAVARQQRHVVALAESRGKPLAVAQLDLFEPRMAREELRVMGDVVDIWRPQTPDRDHEEAHSLRY
jgi:hypothetical protein